MGIERSSGFDWHLDQVRRMPQETEEEKESKKEQAKLLRMEAFLDNAQLAKLLTERLEANPALPLRDLIEQAQKSDLVIHPEAVNDFIADLSFQKEVVLGALGDLRKEGKSKHQGVGKTLYEWAVPLQEKFGKDRGIPNGEVIADTSYPLALILYVKDRQDFARIDPRQNIGGFYRHQAEYDSSYRKGDRYKGKLMRARGTFPLVAVQSADPKKYITGGAYIVSHEKGHAENRVFVESLKKDKKKVVWGKYEMPYEHHKELLGKQKLLGVFEDEIDMGKILDSEAYNSALDYALAHAKDELLAEYKAYYRGMPGHLNNLLQRSGLYDYFSNRLGIKPGTKLYEALWSEYEAILKDEVQAVSQIIAAYETSFALGDRTDLLKWVLAQIPISEWKTQLEGALFFKEAEELKRAGEKRAEVYKKQEYKDVSSRRAGLVGSVEMEVYQNQGRPLFKYLRKFEKGMAEATLT